MRFGINFILFRWPYAPQGTVAPLPLQPPSNLQHSETSTAITFTWSPPVSWGPGPHASNRYQYEVRKSSVGGPAINTRSWTGAAVYNSESVSFNWETASTEIIQFRVRSRDNAGNSSTWVTSEAITEGSTRRSRRFSNRFSRRFG